MGLSRNAVIGKISRLNLSRPKGGQQKILGTKAPLKCSASDDP
jgi:hypothetical protein